MVYLSRVTHTSGILSGYRYTHLWHFVRIPLHTPWHFVRIPLHTPWHFVRIPLHTSLAFCPDTVAHTSGILSGCTHLTLIVKSNINTKTNTCKNSSFIYNKRRAHYIFYHFFSTVVLSL